MIFWMAGLVTFGALVGALTLCLAKRGGFGTDESHGVQKMHRHWVPRLGGIPVFATFVVGCLLWEHLGFLGRYSAQALILCSLPVFTVGLWEDLSRRSGIGMRLVVTMIAAALAWYFMDGQLRRLDIPAIDTLLLRFSAVSLLITAVAVAGVVHAVNIIDGYNGLCGFFAVFAFGAISVVAATHDDIALHQASLIVMLGIVGFLFWNYPFGRLFLGDAGAYFIGFLLAEFSILLVSRNPAVSPWCALLINIYPVWETLFSMLRRASSGGFRQMGQADATHLHHLIHRRLVKSQQHRGGHRTAVFNNAMTTPYLLVLVLMSVMPAILFPDRAGVLFGFCVLFAVSYTLFYRMIVRLRVPRWMVIRPLARWIRTHRLWMHIKPVDVLDSKQAASGPSKSGLDRLAPPGDMA